MHSLCARIVTYLITKIRVCLSFYRHSTRAHALLYGIVKKKEHSGPRFKTRAYSITGHCVTEATSRIFLTRLFDRSPIAKIIHRMQSTHFCK